MIHHSQKIYDMKIKPILTLSLCCMALSYAYGSTDIVAHRGYWQTQGASQNSIRSLIKADSIGAYASEFDVWRSRDGVLFCNHDRVFKGVAIEEADSNMAHAVVLDNGENMPTLRAMLSAACGMPRLRLVLELKEHTDKANEEAAVKECVEMVKEMGLAQRTDFITFSKEALGNFVKYAPEGTDIYYLTGDLTPEQVLAAGANGIDYHINEFRKNPDWIDRAHALGMKVNVWTVDDSDDMRWCIEKDIDLITTNRPEEALRILGTQ